MKLRPITALALWCCLLAAPGLAQAQNLVPNGGFEESWELPEAQASFPLLKHWQNANGPHANRPYGTPDYLHLQGKGDAQLPNAYFGTTLPQEGKAAVGLITYAEYRQDYREYITVPLTEQLEVGTEYTVSFWVSSGKAPHYGRYASNMLGVALSKTPVLQQVSEVLPVPPHYAQALPQFSTGWDEVTFNFTAEQPYQYLTLGNFADDAHTVVRPHGYAGDSCAYYFIDNVALYATHGGGPSGGTPVAPLPSMNDLITQINVPPTPQPPTTPVTPQTPEDIIPEDSTPEDSLPELSTTYQLLFGDPPNQGLPPANLDSVPAPEDSITQAPPLPTPEDSTPTIPLEETRPPATPTAETDTPTEIPSETPTEVRVDTLPPLLPVGGIPLLFNPDTIEIGQRFVVQGLLFEQSMHYITPESEEILDKIYAVLTEYPRLKVELQGYTSNEGNPYKNQLLSQRRVEEVRVYLANKGIEEERLVVAGYGEKYARYDNTTPEGRRKNRRVEIMILQK